MPSLLRRASSSLRRLPRDRRGATAVEFGLVCVPFLALILFCLQLFISYFAQQGLETFTQSTARQILIGKTQGQNLTQAQFKAALCASLPSLFSCSRFYVDVQTASAFANAVTAQPSLTYDASDTITTAMNYDLGTSGDIVVLRVMYVWPIVGMLVGTGLANATGTSRLLMATAVIKTEIYQ